MWCTIIATNGNCSIFFNNDSRVLLEKQHNQYPKYKRNSRKTKVDQNEVINKDKMADHENAPPVYLVVMTRKRQWFSWTCWSLAVLALRLSTIFFKDRGVQLEKKNCLQIAYFLQSGYIYTYRGKTTIWYSVMICFFWLWLVI